MITRLPLFHLKSVMFDHFYAVNATAHFGYGPFTFTYILCRKTHYFRPCRGRTDGQRASVTAPRLPARQTTIDDVPTTRPFNDRQHSLPAKPNHVRRQLPGTITTPLRHAVIALRLIFGDQSTDRRLATGPGCVRSPRRSHRRPDNSSLYSVCR